jgi:multiple sugar transport system substrate-binding protein
MSSKKMNRREFLKTGTISAAGLVAAASGLSMTSARPIIKSRRAQTTTTITMIDPWAGTTFGAAHDAQIQRFMESHPNIVVERSTVNFNDFVQLLIQGAAAGELPDIALIDNPNFHGFAALGVLADLTDKIKSWGEAELYFPGHWSSTVYQGVNYGVPCFSNCLAWWTNTEMKEAAGVEVPTTWDELREVAKALTTREHYGAAVSGRHTEEGAFQFEAFLWSAGSDLATINDEGGQKALQLWVDLVNEGSMSQGILGMGQWAVKDEFGNRRAAMMLNGPWNIPDMKASYPDVKWEVSAIPMDAVATSILGGENYGITKDSPNIDAAWEYVAWTQEPANYAQFIKELAMFPSRSDVAEDPHWAEDPVLNVFLEQIKIARARAYGANYTEMSNAVQDAMQAALTGQMPVKDALDKAAGIITPLLPTA